MNNVLINGKNIEVTPAMKEHINKKLKGVNKFLKKNEQISVAVSKRSEVYSISIFTEYKHKEIKIKKEFEDFYSGFSELSEKFERKIRKIHDALYERRHVIKTDNDEDVDLEDIIDQEIAENE